MKQQDESCDPSPTADLAKWPVVQPFNHKKGLQLKITDLTQKISQIGKY